MDYKGTGSLTFVSKEGDISIPLHRKRRTACTLPLVPAYNDDGSPNNDDVDQIKAISASALNVLWHQRLAHLHDRAICDLHNHVDGIPNPKLKRSSDIHVCDSCYSCKLRKADQGKGDTRKQATTHFQGISLNWAFMCQKSKSKERLALLQGLSGQQAYLLVADHHTDKLYGYCSGSKKPPIKWLNALLHCNGWSTPTQGERTTKEPIHPDHVKSLKTARCPTSTVEAQALEKKNGFGYRAAMGKLVYAYAVCRLDIGNAVAELSKFSSNPAQEHYTAVKGVFCYLRAAKDQGIVYWRPKPRNDLPKGTIQRQPLDKNDLDIKYPSAADQLCVFFDAAHATDLKTQRSMTGFAVMLNGGTIFYQAKWQPTVATTSTEAEFITSVAAAKAVKYFHSILDKLGVKQTSPTQMYGDNQAAIMMVNAKKPTERSRHIDIQYFAIQEWKERGLLVLDHINIKGTINPSDTLTKALGWVLHRRHCTHLMGLAGLPAIHYDVRQDLEKRSTFFLQKMVDILSRYGYGHYFTLLRIGHVLWRPYSSIMVGGGCQCLCYTWSGESLLSLFFVLTVGSPGDLSFERLYLVQPRLNVCTSFCFKVSG